MMLVSLRRRLGVKVATALGLLALTAVGYFVGVKTRTKAASASGYTAGRASVTPAVRERYIASQKHAGEQEERERAGLLPALFAEGDGGYSATYFMSTTQETQDLSGRDTVLTEKLPHFIVGSRILDGQGF